MANQKKIHDYFYDNVSISDIRLATKSIDRNVFHRELVSKPTCKPKPKCKTRTAAKSNIKRYKKKIKSTKSNILNQSKTYSFFGNDNYDASRRECAYKGPVYKSILENELSNECNIGRDGMFPTKF